MTNYGRLLGLAVGAMFACALAQAEVITIRVDPETGKACIVAPEGVSGSPYCEEAPPPVDCEVSAWGDWQPGPWSACAAGSQSRNETRVRSVVTEAANGGAACPALAESRVVSQPCAVEPPPVTGLTNFPGGPPWASGVGQITPNGFKNWAAWMERQPEAIAAWADNKDGYGSGSWNEWKGPIQSAYILEAFSNTAAAPTTTIILRYPLMPHDIDPGMAGNQSADNCGSYAATAWKRLASGEFDAMAVDFAKSLKALYVAKRPAFPTGKHLVLSPGWEMTGAWYAWSICGNYSEFKDWWAVVVNAVRAELPDIKIDISPARTWPRCAPGKACQPVCKLDCFMPDPSTYDYISRSAHNSDPIVNNQGQFTAHHVLASNSHPGIQELIDYAKARGKKFALTEWGTQTGTQAQCPDEPTTNDEQSKVFVEGVSAILAANAPHIAYDTYFSTSCAQLHNERASHAQTRASFKRLWQ